MANYVYIATSLDGFIARKDGAIDWLDNIPNPTNSDYGYYTFIAGIDCHLIGRGTYEVVLGFNHVNYRHMAVIGEAVRAELATDFG